VPCFSEIRNITIYSVRTFADENCRGAKDVSLDKVKKEIELKQAKDAIKDTRKKESTVKFSLLFNIQFPPSHGMPKEIELIMKVPEIQNDITVLNEKKSYEILKNRASAEAAFYDVVSENHNLNYLNERIEDSTVVLGEVTKKYKTGKGKKEDVDYVQNQLDGFKQQRQSAILNLSNKKRALSKIIGIDISNGYDFTEYFPEVNITREQLPTILEYAKKNDFGVFEKTQARKLAERDTQEILQIYRNKYSKYIGDIEAYINEHKEEIDYEEFIKKYNYTLYNIDSPWYGAYVINLLFFKIRIPKEWFKGEYSGTRYMEDQKYALFVSLAERDKARKEEQDKIDDLENSIYNEYSNLKQIESSYKNIIESLEKTKNDYEIQKQKNKMGIVSFSSLESIKNDFYKKQNSAFETKMDYAKSLSSFNLSTGGYINKLLSGGDFLESDLESGVTFIDNPSWFIKNSLTEYNFEFGVNIPEEYGVNYYQLYYNNQPVGGKTAIDKTIIHSPIAYNDVSVLEVRLFKDSKLQYTAKFDGETYEGELILKEATDNQENSQNEIGNWKISKTDALRSSLSVTASNIEYTEFELFNGEYSIGRVKKGEELDNLSLYFSDINQIKIIFYNDGKTVKAGQLLSLDETNGVIIEK